MIFFSLTIGQPGNSVLLVYIFYDTLSLTFREVTWLKKNKVYTDEYVRYSIATFFKKTYIYFHPVFVIIFPKMCANQILIMSIIEPLIFAQPLSYVGECIFLISSKPIRGSNYEQLSSRHDVIKYLSQEIKTSRWLVRSVTELGILRKADQIMKIF